MRRAKTAVLAVVALISFQTPAAAAPPRWSISGLGAFFNVVEAHPTYGLNDLGQVTGFGTSAFYQGAPAGPFLTQPNSLVNWASRPGDPPVNPTLFVDQIVNGTYNNQPWNPNTDQTLRPRPSAVNNQGVTTGLGDSYPHAMTFLGTTTQTTAIGPTGVVCVGHAINDANVVAGVRSGHAIRIAGGVVTDLGSFSATPGASSVPYAINQSGTIVGQAITDIPSPSGPEYHPFRWTEAGGLVDLGTAGGYISAAYDIDAQGTVVGYTTDLDGAPKATIWSPTNVMTMLQDIPGQVLYRNARWITNAGWIIGTAYFYSIGTTGYYLRHEGQTYELATLIDDDGTHWTDLVIHDVNAIGQITGYGINDISGTGARAAFLLSPGMVTATTVALIDAAASTEGVVLRWHSSEPNLLATLERRGEGEEWSRITELRCDASGVMRHEDTDIVAGRRYGYRLAVGGDSGVEYFGETWVDVPAGVALAIEGFHPNPGAGIPTVSFTLPSRGPARVELLDIMGRRVMTRNWASLEGGRHMIRLDDRGDLEPGVYLVRLSFEGRTVSASGVLLEH